MKKNRDAIVAYRLRELRKQKEIDDGRPWTADQVGKAIGIGQSTYSNYENEIRKPSLDRIEELAAFYKVTPSYLAAFTDHKGSTGGDALHVTPMMTESAKEMSINPSGDYSISIELLEMHGLRKESILVDAIQDNAMAPHLIKGDVVIVKREPNLTIETLPLGIYCIKEQNGRTWMRWVKREINGTVKVYPENSTHYDSITLSEEDFKQFTILGTIFRVIRKPKFDDI
ncbi:helix-turn-helix domain-containing protein [Vibrio cholerae]|nr:LexA family transcriptional regulator [Vibrio cholerae]